LRSFSTKMIISKVRIEFTQPRLVAHLGLYSAFNWSKYNDFL
jgi:hypothetical protein